MGFRRTVLCGNYKPFGLKRLYPVSVEQYCVEMVVPLAQKLAVAVGFRRTVLCGNEDNDCWFVEKYDEFP